MTNNHLLHFFLILTCVLFIPSVTQAQLEFIINGYEEKFLKNDEGYGAEIKLLEKEKVSSIYIYEKPNLKALAHMYWALGLYKLNDNYNVDEFMRINECDIFKKFSSDELEWRKIREAAKVFIKDNKSKFPTRFIFTLPLKLLDYNPRKQAFEIQDKYKIISSRRFELYASDYSVPPCSKEYPKYRGYPRIINIEFSRPLNLVYVPMPEKMANDYIKKITKKYYSWYEPRLRTKELMYGYRKVFLTLRIKIFSYGKFGRINTYGLKPVQMMGILESYAIYEDKKLTNLIFQQNYVSNKKKGKLNIRLKEQYEILRIKSKNGGILSY